MKFYPSAKSTRALAFLSLLTLCLASFPGSALASTVIFLTSGTSWTVPADFSSLVSIEAIGAGGNGAAADLNNEAGSGGGGGAYAKITSLSGIVAGNVYNIQIGSNGGSVGSSGSPGSADTRFNSGSTLYAQGGQTGDALGDTSAGGSAAASVGSTKFNGGSGAGGANAGGGGGGAGGPNGAGNAGTGSGGQGGSGDNGSGGAGGSAGGGSGGNGAEWDASHGSGGGGGGGPYNWANGGNAGSYGAGGGGGGRDPVAGGGQGAGGTGAQGLIVIIYSPVVAASCTLSASPTNTLPGHSSTLTWTSANATAVSIDNGIGTVTPTSGGTTSVSPSVTTTYTMTATGSAGNGTCSATVTVAPFVLSGNVLFKGNLAITGSLSKGSGTFEIDDPADPANEILFHSFVESPDAMDVYNGNATLDQNGQVTIQLPDYFDALNDDVRYQFFALYQAMPNLYISQEEENNQFSIAGGEPGGQITWQITGIRHDPYILAHPIIPEVEKGPGQPVNKGQCLFAPLCQ